MDIFATALGVDAPWFISDKRFDLEAKRLDVWIDFRKGSKFPLHEGGEEWPVYDTEEKVWRHLNFFQHECHLHIRVPRVRTDDGRTLTVLPPWAGKMLGFTLLFEALLIELCRNMPIRHVAKLVNVSEKKLWHMLKVYVYGAQENDDCEEVTQVGMDETSVAKGHSYITLFVDLAKRRTLLVAEGKGSETVQEFAQNLKDRGGDPARISDVSCDMSPAFIKGVRENLPQAAITFDKFHIIKIINEAVDKIRRDEAITNPLLRKARYVFLKNDANLTAKQRQKKEELQVADLNLRSMEALRMRETFQQIYNAASAPEFVELLKQWLQWVKNSSLKAMHKAAQMVEDHWSGIVNWHSSRLNNAILEGLNSVLQAAKRKARGYSPRNFAIIALLLTGKLNLSKINPHLPTRFA